MNDRLHALTQVAALAVLATGGLIFVADRGGRLRPAGGGSEANTAAAGSKDSGMSHPGTIPSLPTVPAPQAASAASAAASTPTSRAPARLPAPATALQSDAATAGPSDPPPPTPTVPANRIGIIPGHWEYDSGAVCPDGLREVDVTTDVALRVQALLEVRGFDVDLLPEHEPGVPQEPTRGYRGGALVAIHADSCDVPGVSGYKVARGVASSTPEEDDRLVDCLNHEYAAATLLPRHDDTITADMLNYYVFGEIGSDTPAAIIELGFLGGDRAALDRLRYEMALGVANGVSCFLR